jgi:hypothetical protein
MEIGTLLYAKMQTGIVPIPVFIWEIVGKGDDSLFIINASGGKTLEELKTKFPRNKLLLPYHSRFAVLTWHEMIEPYEQGKADPYVFVTDMIKGAHVNSNTGFFFINCAYVMMHLVQIVKFSDSVYCNNAINRIKNDEYSTIEKLTPIKDKSEYGKQNAHNIAALFTLNFVPKKFAILKIITTLKEIAEINFPSGNDLFSNSLIEQLCLGMILSHYKANRDKIRSVTINYSHKFPGDFKVFQQFTSLIDKFESEIGWYETLNAEEDKFRFMAALSGIEVPEKEKGRGVIMKFLEFDLGFWQRLILLNIVDDVPVKKPFKGGYSISYNYMLLLPFFKWISPQSFPDYNDKNVKAENYQKIMVARMKSFIEGKIS